MIISNKIVLLSEKEKVKVKNNFSLFCILKINFSNEIMANSLIVYMENNEENIIYYTILDNKKVIVSSTGPVSRLSKKKQLKKLEEQLKEIDLIKNPLKNHINNISINNTNILNRKTTNNMYFSSLNNYICVFLNIVQLFWRWSILILIPFKYSCSVIFFPSSQELILVNVSPNASYKLHSMLLYLLLLSLPLYSTSVIVRSVLSLLWTTLPNTLKSLWLDLISL